MLPLPLSNIQMGGATVLYTGDYSMEEDRHLMAAEVPSVSPDVLIVESTFGLMEHPKREDKEHRLLSAVEEVRLTGFCVQL